MLHSAVKKALSAILVLLLCLFGTFAAGCAHSDPPGVVRLLRETGRTQPRFAFAPEDLLFGGGAYYAYYSLFEADDLLLTLNTDENGGVRRAALTVPRQAASAGALCDFAKTLFALLAKGDAEAMAAALGLGAEAYAPMEQPRRFQNGHYTCVFFTGDLAASFWITDDFFYDPS